MASGDVTDLVESLKDALEVDGSLTRVRAFVHARANHILTAVSEPSVRGPSSGGADRHLIQALIAEYLAVAGLHSTLAVFDVETGAAGVPRSLDVLDGEEMTESLGAAAAEALSRAAIDAALVAEAETLRDALERFSPGRISGPRAPDRISGPRAPAGRGEHGGGGHLPAAVTSAELGLDASRGGPLLALLVKAAKNRRYADALGRWRGEGEGEAGTGAEGLLRRAEEDAVPGVTGRHVPPPREEALVGPARAATALPGPSMLPGPQPFAFHNTC
jgi:hypothetical protein